MDKDTKNDLSENLFDDAEKYIKIIKDSTGYLVREEGNYDDVFHAITMIKSILTCLQLMDEWEPHDILQSMALNALIDFFTEER